MVDAEAATAAAQALADQFASGEQAVKPEAEEAVPAENGESNQNKRKFDGEDDEVDASMRKRASFTDPTAGDEGAGVSSVFDLLLRRNSTVDQAQRIIARVIPVATYNSCNHKGFSRTSGFLDLRVFSTKQTKPLCLHILVLFQRTKI